MKLIAHVHGELSSAGREAERIEAAGYDTVATHETSHDPFLQAALVAEHTTKASVMTAIAVAFSRNPMLLAQIGHDLNALSKGRFILGLGSQIKAHITRRFSMPWSHPAARMKEFIRAMHAIWDTWYDGKPLKFEGAFYTHTLMTPYFTPLDTNYGRPKVTLAAVGDKMTETAAAVADGLHCHAFSTERYIREVTVPTVEKGLKASGRSRDKFTLIGSPFIITGETDEAIAAGCKAVRNQIAFYASTPTYIGVLDLHGWGGLHPELHRLSKLGRWEDMGTLITDDMLNTFAVVGKPTQVAKELKRRYKGLLDEISMSLENVAPSTQATLIAELKAL